MRPNFVKASLKTAVLAVTVLLLGASATLAQQQINLTAAPTTATLPDSSVVPMWGYSCGTAVIGSAATCAPLNPNTLTPKSVTPKTWVANTVYSVGQLVLDANGNVQTVTMAGTSGGTAPGWNTTGTTTDGTVTWTFQSSLASFLAVATSWSPVVITVPYVSTGTSLTINLTNNLSFANGNTVPTSIMIVGQVGGGLGNSRTAVPSPDHSNLSSNTVTWPTAGTAPSLVPPPQGPRVQSFATEVAAGATTTLNWPLLKPGTYLLESGTHPSIQGPMGLYGILVVTAAPTATSGVETAPGTAYPGVSYDAEIPLLLSEIDPVQNNTVNQAVNTAGFTETAVWSGQPGGCGNPTSSTYLTCYPPAVNYTPLYYTINGVAFSKTSPTGSLFPITPATITPAANTTGSVLVRLVNAGSRMHVPAIVGSQVAGATGGTNPIVTGFTVIAEDGNPLPGVPKIKSEVFMAAGKTFDVMINGQATSGTTLSPYTAALPVYDRELSLSGNAIERDAGMLAYIGINPTAGLPVAAGTGVFAAAVARADNYSALVAGQTVTVSDPSKGVIANDTNVYGVTLLTPAANGTVTLYANGTFTYVPTGTATSDSFTYCANGTVTAGVCSSGVSATVTLGASNIADSGITCNATSFNANTATYLAIKTPGVLAGCTDGANLPLTVDTSTVTATGMTVVPDANGGFTATASGAGTYSFSFQAKNSLGAHSAATIATVVFPTGSGLTVTVLDGYDKTTQITDYRWIIEEDRTFYIDPKCTANPPPAGCPTVNSGIVPTLGTNFHTSYMPYVAQGCTGQVSCEGGQTAIDPKTGVHNNVVCDVGNGLCRPDTTGNGMTWVMPGAVPLDPTKRYYISILPGDAANPFINGQTGPPNCAIGKCGHGMGGAPISPAQTAVTVLTQPSPYPPGKLSVFVFEDDFPLNGEQDGGGGIDVLAPQEPGLGGFQIHLWDAMGGNGDFTGQMTYDMFNQPLTNSLAGTIDPNNGNDACPVGVNERSATTASNPTTLQTDPTATGITGMIVTCPKYESDGKTLSPLAGQAVIANLMPGRWGAIATPGADRIARGEEWLQTNTLDGQKAHDVFTRIGEPSYFQEFGPASYHVSIGFANPAIINGRRPYLCNGTDPNSPQPGVKYTCNNTITGKVTGERLSRTPDERLYSSGSHDTYYWSQCYVSFGDPDGEDFAFTKCNGDGTFTLSGLPAGDWRVTVFDQWNDLLVDGLSTPVAVASGGGTTAMGDIASTQWQANLYTRTFIDDNKDGISQSGESGIPFANVAVRLRDGSLENLLVTDFTGTANFNETFPLFSWYTVETDVTRYKNTGTHVVYDVGGPADGSPSCGIAGYPPCGTSKIGAFLANTAEIVSVPANLRVPGSVYCGSTATADCTGKTIQTPVSDPPSVCTTSSATPPITTCSTQLSSGRIDNPWTGGVEGWQGFPGQNNFLEFGKEPYVPGENGGIKGHVIYASTRPFDDPMMLVQTQWEPLVPHVTINLYQEGFAADNVTPTLKLVDTTQTSSWDDYAQGFRADGVTPNMSCPGQGASSGAIPDLFYFSLYNQPNYLDFYNNVLHGTAPNPTALPNNSQFKCYDGMHNWNQIQPAPYDGMYKFPSVTAVDANGKPTATGTNCTICTANNAVPMSDLYYGIPQLPAGKYVVEVVLPPGYELVKEEDKNILIGDNFIAPVTQEFGALGNIFIIPDQASVNASQQYPGAGYNANNAQNPTQSLGASPQEGIVPGFIPEPVWPCVGEARIVPDYISLYPQSKQVAPFAGATRNLCDRKEVTLDDQAGAIAKFYIYTSTHIASKFTGGITDDYTSEFDPFSPMFGEKFSPPNLPVSVKDWAGNEISRVYADHWGTYDGMTYSTWEVNPPNPTGYSPTMMVFCMNDPGPIPGPGNTMITDPLYTPGYSQFCYELPFMPGTTQYLDTPVVPTSAFAGAGYNNVDCAYPDATPAIAEVDGDQTGPWVSAAGNTLTITALGNQTVPNYAYSGPSATTPPFNQKTITRHYGFGSCTLNNGACSNGASVTIGGQPATVTGWSDTSITVTVPNNVPACAVQQQAQYVPTGTTSTQCGQLVITAANGKQSIDTVSVTIGGKAPTHVAASGTIQSAIDAANPGDLIMIDPATHNELLVMWKPVRLQGVGAASSVINANTHPAGKLDVWRQYINCLFGLSLNGTPISTTNPFDSTGTISCPGTGWTNFVETPNNAQVDPLPAEAVIGWDASLNGNLAQLLQEPSLMGALEGAGITVLAKGVNFPSPEFLNQVEGVFPAGTTLLTGPVNIASGVYATGDANALCNAGGTNPFPSNFSCNPSSIDGLAITDSSQGGGGIFVHAWAHNVQIANNRIYSNAGTLSGGINVGQGEFAPQQIQGATLLDPGSCATSTGVLNGAQLPYCSNLNVNIHNNNISLNSSTGDELFSGTPAGAGGISICSGSDYYKFNYNWVCGNLSSGDGGGVGHLGFSYNGDIEHNSILFNQSLNPTIPANGGGLLAMGTPDIAPPCGVTTDQDCVSAPGTVLPSDGVGPGLVINANLIMGNAAESGSGGGLRLQQINGSDVLAFPTTPSQWYSPTITNNIIADNVAGWDGGGISLVDALNVNIINNTVVSNSTTASAGILFTTIGYPLASSEGANCVIGTETSCPQVAGLVSIQNSSVLQANLPATITCPSGHYAPGTSATKVGTTLPTCATVSYPLLANDVFWQNSAYYIGVGALSAQYQQNVVSLYNAFSTTLAPTQPKTIATTANGNGATITGGTGACIPGVSYWDIGVRGDMSITGHESGVTLAPTYSVITDAGDYPGLNNLAGNPTFVSQYCDGSRTPPEFGASGWAVPPGISDATVPNPIFNLTAVATVDEGNNWINMRWGPLSMTNPTVVGTDGNYGGGSPLANYAPATGSPLIDVIGNNSPTYALAPTTDFFGNPRPDSGPGGQIDIGAVEVQNIGNPSATVAPTSVSFGNQLINTASAPLTVLLSNLGNAPLAVSGISVTGTNAPEFVISNPCGTSVSAGSSCIISITFTPTALAARSASLVITSNDPANPTLTVPLTGTGAAPVASVNPTTLAFGNQFVNTASAAQTVTLSNTGNYPLSVASIGLSDTTNYSQTNNCGGSVPAGSSCTISITFAPTVMGTLNPTLTVTDNSNAVPGSTQTVSITGFGIEPIAGVSPTTLAFGVELINSASNAQTVTLSNTGNWPLTIANISLTGTNTNQFATSGSTCPIGGAGLAAGTTCTINVTFNPTSTGAKTASLTFTDNSLGVAGSTQNIAVSGTGVNTIVTPASLTFAATPVGSSSPLQTLTLRNVSGSSKAIGITFSGPFARSGGSCGANLGNNGTCTINVFFHPTTPGSASGSVAITLGGTAVGNSPVSLSGTGIGVPALTSISPNSGVRGDTPVNVTLAGTYLTGTSAITVSGTGVTVSNINVVSDTQVTATFTIQAGANASTRNVSVNTPGGTSNTVTFTVVNPTDTGVTPNTGLRGTSVPVTISGTGLATATGASVSGTGVTVSGFTAVNDTTATATFVIANNATLGALNVTVVTPSGNITLTGAFTVTGPTLTSISPTSGARGTTVPVILSGTNLTGATAVNVSGGAGSVTCTITGTPTATTVNANCAITANAGLTARNVTVTTPIGTTNNVTFTVVNPPAPTLTSVNPNTGVRGTTVSVTLTGTNFTTAGTTFSVSGTGVSVSGVTVTSSTSATATFTLTSSATLGLLNVTVTNPNTSATLNNAFTVTGATLTSISPTSGTHNTTVPVTLTGTNLTGATVVTISGGGVACTVTGSTATTVSANCAITNGASHTARNVTATTPIGATNTLTGAFTVN